MELRSTNDKKTNRLCDESEASFMLTCPWTRANTTHKLNLIKSYFQKMISDPPVY